MEKNRIRYQDSDCTAICGTVWTITITRKLVNIDTKVRKSGQSDRLNQGVKKEKGAQNRQIHTCVGVLDLPASPKFPAAMNFQPGSLTIDF